MQEHSFHQEGSDVGGNPEGRADNPSGQAEVGEPIRPEQVEAYPADVKDSIVQSLSKNVLNMGNQIRALADENARLKAEVERLRASSFVTSVPVEQYERLLKAGDEIHAFLINYIVDSRISSAYLNKLDDKWLAAKEGKPSV